MARIVFVTKKCPDCSYVGKVGFPVEDLSFWGDKHIDSRLLNIDMGFMNCLDTVCEADIASDFGWVVMCLMCGFTRYEEPQ